MIEKEFWKNLQKEVLEATKDKFSEYDELAFENSRKVLQAFRKHKISEYHFRETTGYGYDDVGRAKIDELWADIFDAESALVRMHFASGTHALSTVLFALLNKGEKLLAATDTPYDTLHNVIGYRKKVKGSLRERGVYYSEVPMTKDGVDFDLLCKAMEEKIKVILIQRSRGYSLRSSLSISDIKKLIKFIKEKQPNCICFVDNCYGEFVESLEPLSVGADCIAGSLIKNPGGGLAVSGAYVAGKKEIVEDVANVLFAPGLGGKIGASLISLRLIFQGLFMAPQIVNQALKTATFAAGVFSYMGYDVFPGINEKRTDIIQAIKLNDPKKMVAFAQALQAFSPVESYVKPIPSEMAGYDEKIVMAGGSFVQGSSIELSADGPLREPYVMYLQGGLNFYCSIQAVIEAVKATMLFDL